MRFAWCDAVVLPVWVLVTLFAVFMSLGANATPGLVFPPFPTVWFELSLIIVLPLWIFLRAIDLATGGPARRRGYTVRPIRH